ncbi:hypothetical protein C1646_763288 [Rhizophagus diaphanus]|nr:hypothetical protein C1646_763288 [Rhizophagus diaphanus] [Rhizophagus sp. MUCL 43196]
MNTGIIDLIEDPLTKILLTNQIKYFELKLSRRLFQKHKWNVLDIVLKNDNLIFKYAGDYRKRLIYYLNFINHKDEFFTFMDAFVVDLHKTERTPFSTPTSIIGIVTNNDFGFLSERQVSVEATVPSRYNEP